MKIKKLRITNFKSLVDVTIEDLSQINMIYGQNNSGKSNILKFIDLLFSGKIPLVPETKVDESRGVIIPKIVEERSSNFWEGMISNEPFLYNVNAKEKTINFDVTILFNSIEAEGFSFYGELNKEFFKTDKPKDVSITLAGNISAKGNYDSEIKLNSVKLEGRDIYISSPTKQYFVDIAAGDSGNVLKQNGFEILNSLLSIFNDSVLLLDNDRYFEDEKENLLIGELKPKNFKNWFHNVSLDSGRYGNLIKIFTQIGKYKPNGDANFTKAEKSSPILPDIRFDYTRSKDKLNIILKNGNSMRLPLESYGTGIQQLLYILAKIAEKNPKVILLEEIELNLSPMSQDTLLKHFLLNFIQKPTEKLSQIFFTTHSPLLCYNEHFIIHNVVISEGGETKVKKVGDREEIKAFYPAEIMAHLVKQK